MILGVLEVFDVLRSIEPEYPGHFSIPSIFAWFMIQRSAYDPALHEMHSVVPIRYGSKSIPPKLDWLPFLWIVLYPIFDPYSIRFLLSSIRISSVVRRREDIFLNLFDGLVPVGLSECPFADSNHSILCPIHHTWVEIVEIIWSA